MTVMPQPLAAQRSCAAEKNPQKCAHYNFAQCGFAAGGMSGLCMRECVLVAMEMRFSSTFSAAAGVTGAAAGLESSSKACTA
jgi:hypothetical protein